MVRGEEPDLAIHEELRGVLHALVTAMNSGQYDQMLPYLTENVEATSITQETMSGRAGMPKYFQEWFGPTGYMCGMQIKMDADGLTELSDRSWGLVRGKALGHYEAKVFEHPEYIEMALRKQARARITPIFSTIQPSLRLRTGEGMPPQKGSRRQTPPRRPASASFARGGDLGKEFVDSAVTHGLRVGEFPGARRVDYLPLL